MLWDDGDWIISNAKNESFLVRDTSEASVAAWQCPGGHPRCTLFRAADERSTAPDAVSTEEMQTSSDCLRRGIYTYSTMTHRVS